jgi:hypothetical protein
MPSSDRLKKIQTVLNEFALGSMNYAKNRIYLAKEEGGARAVQCRKFSDWAAGHLGSQSIPFNKG